MKLNYRLGLDLGTNSIGWCMYRLDDTGEPTAVHRMGVRIFADGRDPKTLASLAAERRLARQMRRRRDRMLKRKHRFLEGLTRFGLFPTEEKDRKALQLLDPFVLRRRALDEAITPFELGRCLFHLGRKRGFRSSRKDNKSSDAAKETGKINTAIARLRQELAAVGARTVGEYLAGLHDTRRPVKARRRPDGEYVLYLQRDMIADEFDQIWASQARFHGNVLSEEARAYLRDTLLFQRKLREVQPGRCQFERSEFREPLASPLQQRFRILQELNNLRLVDARETRALTLAERNLCAEALSTATKREVTFAALRKLIGAARGSCFNLETDAKRNGLKRDVVLAQIVPIVGSRWAELSPDQQRSLALTIEGEDSAEALTQTLQAPPWGFEKATAEQLSGVSLPDGYGSLSRKALERILPELEREVVTYDVAVQRAGYGSHSQADGGPRLQRLPYYGEVLTGYTSPTPTSKVPAERDFGRIANPTVHIGLNQLRLVFNEIVRRFGPPQEVIVELARSFGLSGQRRRELISEQKERQDINVALDEELARLGQRTNHENRLRLRLFNEMKKKDPMGICCVYSGEPISPTKLFSAEVEIDHILPFSRSLHDGIGNKILCKRRANRDKLNRTPFDAFGHSPPGYDWDAITKRAERLLDGRQVRLFQESALDDFLGDRDFLDRQLTDTQYLSRVAREYLTVACPANKVWVSTGRLTGLVRAKLGMNSLLSVDARKNRDDHRHHALDAAVIGICSRSLIKRVADAAALAERDGENRAVARLDPPWPTFRDDVAAHLARIVVSHRPDRGAEGRLHNDTNYGMRELPDKPNKPPLVVHRVPIDSIKNDVVRGQGSADIVDEHLRARLEAAIDGKTSPADTKAALAQLSAATGIRRVRVSERLAVIPIPHRKTGTPYRWVKGDGNYCYDIVHGKNGKWTGDIVQRFHAHARSFRDRDHKDGQFVMRIMGGDMVAIEESGVRRVMLVVKLSSGKISLADHQEANVDARNRSKDDDFEYLTVAPSTLQQLRGRLVGVDLLGYVNDPGFHDDRSDRRDRQ
jgi:CRISPR-associated endonuclease Csn1